jgi:signal transduction histidine kinase/CheY-like chemotaxis protein
LEPTGFLDGGGRMGALMRSHDWSRTELGEPASWPETLKSAVSTCLASRFPMVIWWGPNLLMLYNDAWQPILGDTKHPAGLGRPGRESWPETWPIVGAQFEQALGGTASWHEDLLLASDRHGYMEECYFTYSHSPLRDARGTVVGVLSVVSETSTRVVLERRLRVLRDLSLAAMQAAAAQRPVTELCTLLCALLVHGNPDVPFAALYLAEGDGSLRLVTAQGVDDGRLPPRIDVDEADAWGIAEAHRRDCAVASEHDDGTQPLPGGVWPEPATQRVALPMGGSGSQPGGVLLAGVNSRRRLDTQLLDFLRLAAAQLGTSVSALLSLSKEKEDALAIDALLAKERAARLEAESAARLKDEFLAVLSHELRTPLSAVLGWSRILRMDHADPARVLAALDIIERNARLQTQLITDLLDVSRIMSGNMGLELEPLDLAVVLQGAIATMSPDAEAKGITVECDTARAPGFVRGDARRLQQAVCNLLSNAVKFSGPGGRVRVILDGCDSRALIVVRDEGEGIAPDFLPLLFERFRQADSTASRRHGGLGLGLSIVKQLVELHGGTVSAESDGPDRGATFTIALPVDRAPGADAAPPAEHCIVPVNPGLPPGMKVLVVDDEPDALAMMRRTLEDMGMVVATAAGAEAALEALSNSRFDAMVSDIGMPVRDGHALLADLRARGNAIPAIALTAFAREEDRRKSIESGFRAHVTKPVDSAELRAALAMAIRG